MRLSHVSESSVYNLQSVSQNDGVGTPSMRAGVCMQLSSGYAAGVTQQRNVTCVDCSQAAGYDAGDPDQNKPKVGCTGRKADSKKISV